MSRNHGETNGSSQTLRARKYPNPQVLSSQTQRVETVEIRSDQAPWATPPRGSTMARSLKTSFYSRNDLLRGFLSLQKLGQGISKGFQHSHMGGLETDRVGNLTGKQVLRTQKTSTPLTRAEGGAPLLSQRNMWRGARGGLLGRDQGSTHLDAGSQGRNNALCQELLSHSLALHDKVPQCIQTQLLRAGDKSSGLGSSHTSEKDGMTLSLKLTGEEKWWVHDPLFLFLYLPAGAGPKGIYKL